MILRLETSKVEKEMELITKKNQSPFLKLSLVFWQDIPTAFREQIFPKIYRLADYIN